MAQPYINLPARHNRGHGRKARQYVVNRRAPRSVYGKARIEVRKSLTAF